MQGLLRSALGGLALVTTLSCRPDSASPTAPDGQPELTATALTTVSFHQISTGLISAPCAVTPDNRAYCWSNGAEAAAVPVPGNTLFRRLSVGRWFTCGITTPEDALYCWGSNFEGQLGDGTTTDRAQPTRVASNLRFRQVSAGSHHACAVSVDDIVYCWGWNGFGQLGDGTHVQRLVPTRVAGERHFSRVSAGNYHSCAVAPDGKGFCWGMNSYWQIGNDAPTQRDQLRPRAIVGGLTFTDVQAGYFHTCGVTTRHKAYCWGHNGPELGSVASSNDDYQKTPRLVAGGLPFRAVDGGYYNTCGVTTRNIAYCWGTFVVDGTVTERWNPRRVTNTLYFRQVAASGNGPGGSCGVTLDDRAFCWGRGGTPTQLPGPD